MGEKNANIINSEMKIIIRFMNFLFVGLIFFLSRIKSKESFRQEEPELLFNIDNSEGSDGQIELM